MNRKGIFFLQSDSRGSSGSRTSSLLPRLFALLLLLGISTQASAALNIDLITWGTIGLDSNNVNVGPNKFPVGARVCSESGDAASTATVTFDFDDGNDNFTGDPYINLRDGTLDTLTLDVPANGGCVDAYYEVEITRDSSAYENTREFTITADDGSTSASTPTPRELYIEYLVSQSRNSVTDVLLDGDSVPEGGTMNLVVGQTYDITLVSSTAPNGYEQIETFINFPNIIFQVNSVNTSYSSGGAVDKLYGDACTWDGDPNSPNYQSCLSVGKLGGDVVVTQYNVTILSVPNSPLSNPVGLDSLIYDKSGSSFHYNEDFGATRYANIVTTGIDKQFAPNVINPGGTSTLTFTITNPSSDPITSVNFIDDLPTNVEIEGTTVTYTDCGPSPSPSSLTDGDTSLSFSNLEVAALGTCTIETTVTVPANFADASYLNTTGNLFIDTFDTGQNASDTLTVISQPGLSCVGSETTLATWSFDGSSTNPTIPVGDVSSGTTVVSTGNGTAAIDTVNGNPTPSYSLTGFWSAVTGDATDPATLATLPYFQFSVDSTNYGGIGISLDHSLLVPGDWASNSNDNAYVYSSIDGTNFTLVATINISKGAFQSVISALADISGPNTTYFRVTFDTTKNNTINTAALVDNVNITGCPRPDPPTMSKNFGTDPLLVSSDGDVPVSTLTFNVANSNTFSLTNVGFTDILPTGLLISTTPNVTGPTCSTGSITGETITAAGGTDTISLSGGTLAANSSCSFTVDVVGVTQGSYHNITTPITSDETGPNTTGGPNVGYGDDTLLVIEAPVISKAFNPGTMLTGEISTLTFNITNPNLTQTLNNVAFTDDLPVSGNGDLTINSPNGLTGSCGGGTINAPAGGTSISLSGATLTAGESCNFSIDVLGNTVGSYTNTTSTVTSDEADGNQATADLEISPAIYSLALLKQVGPSMTGPWTNYMATSVGSDVYYRFTIENTGNQALTGVTLADGDLTGTPGAADCVWEDGDGDSIGSAPFALPVAGVGNNDHIAVCVIGPRTAVAGGLTNAATASSNESPDDTDTAEYAITGLSLVKSASPATYSSVGDTITYTYDVENTGTASLAGPVTVDDNKTTVTCPAVSTVGNNDGNLDPGEVLQCTATYDITSADVDLTYVTNIATAHAGGVDSNQDTETVNATPTAVIINKIELRPVLVSEFLSGLVEDGVSNAAATTDGMLALLNAWDPAQAASLSNADSQTILAALEQYLDPDGDGQVAVLRWDTLEELGTMGFYVERKQGENEWVRINDDMLPGLVVAPNGGEYQLADPGPQAGEQYQYRLIEQEVRGTIRTYGPFNVEMRP